MIIYAKVFAKLVLSVGSNILLNPTLNTSPKPHLWKVSPCRFPCCTSYLGLGTCVKRYVPTYMLATVEITWIDLKWLIGPMWTNPNLGVLTANSNVKYVENIQILDCILRKGFMLNEWEVRLYVYIIHVHVSLPLQIGLFTMHNTLGQS